MGELLFPYIDPVETPNNGYMRLGLRSHTKGTFHSFVDAGKELEATKMHRVAKDKFILNITFAWEHAVAVTDEKDEGKLVSHRFPQFSFSPCLAPIFLKFLILDKKFKDYLELCSPGGAGRNRVLKIQEMLKYEIKIPKSTKEQTAIGNFFKQLDETIALHQRQIEKYQKLKIGFLQSIFCSKISLNQEKNTNAWEQRKLGEVIEIIGGFAFKSNEFNSGNIPIIRISNILENGDIGGDFVYYSENEQLSKFKTIANDYLIAMSGATTGKVGKINKEAYINQRVGMFKQNDFCSIDFIGTVIQLDNFKNYLIERWGAGAQPNISLKNLQEYEFFCPSISEQTAIGNFFKQLDETIALHQRKIEKYQFIKQLYLERMFVK